MVGSSWQGMAEVGRLTEVGSSCQRLAEAEVCRGWQQLAEVGKCCGGWPQLAEVGRGWQQLAEVGRGWQRLAAAGRGWQLLSQNGYGVCDPSA